MELRVIQNYYCIRRENKNPLYKKDRLVLQPGVSVLVGCNGSGKTTLLNIIKDHCKDENIPLLDYDNLQQRGIDIEKAVRQERYDLVSELFQDSEGERIMTNFAEHTVTIGRFFASNKDKDELVITMDAVDSGLSIDGMVMLKEQLFPLILEDNKGINVYILVSANAYEFARGQNCLDVSNLEYRQFKDYEDYRSFIIESRQYKNKRYGHGKFEYK